MNLIGITHEAKSAYAYAYNEDTLHIRLRTVKDDIESVNLVWGDPFLWQNGKWIPDAASGQAMDKHLSDDWYDYWFIEIKTKTKRTRYGFQLSDEKQTVFLGAHGVVDLTKHPEAAYEVGDFFNFPYINREDLFKAPDWVKESIWYQIFPERFCNGDPSIDLPGTLPWGSEQVVTNEMKFGGDLRGVIEKLDYLTDLGVNGIYFTPIFKSPSTHKYDTVDYYCIDPSFGTNALFKELVEKAHARGIRVVLDAVFNHCGIDHPFFQDVLQKGKASPYYGYFHMNDEGYETFAFTPKMPKWRTGNPEVERYLLDIGAYWVEQYDIDGWRLDVSNEVSHDFWRKFRKRMKAIKPDFFILGENWDRSEPWLRGDQFDSVMNYEFSYPVWRLLDPAYPDYGVHDYRNSISSLLASYPVHVSENLFNLIDSHDTSRIKTVFGGDVNRVKIAYALLLTHSGAPSIYYGSEVGLEGVHDGNRQCMVWEPDAQDQNLRTYVKHLIEIRKKYRAFKSPNLTWLQVDSVPALLAFEKKEGNERVRCYINASENKVTVLMEPGWKNLFSDTPIPGGYYELDPWSVVLTGEYVAH
ncbi:glycoside hydrolase family 13 protein [Fusibacter tunisiensis]|uniref:Glycosidase n=1 Tax=Fusibacter tunisiensis TaxID=1008308 RepID=A0ABS2MT64_9FIRM|nr:glycoside hydrolase family 13 protein [Fusibacter tunisiensis]MBM7562540.1 glycosidase [Fusibacter tunisiensis]